MAAKQSGNSNILGDIRAESDHKMLDLAFLRTADFLTLIESTDRVVVVGRRGTGKSALFYELKRHWTSTKNTSVITIAPQEEQMLGLRPLVEKFGDKITRIRAGVKIAWKYAMLMEIANHLASNYKVSDKVRATQTISKHLKNWSSTTDSILTKLRTKLKSITNDNVTPADLIADLPHNLQLNEISEELRVLLEDSGQLFVFLTDRLDEGYEPDIIGVGIIDGVIYGTNEVLNEFKNVIATLFLRDNIFRAVAHFDPDFSRNVEGQVLRLHWDSHQLLNLVSARLRQAFDLKTDNNLSVWKRCTANELQGETGFKKCLQLTLYRPRDILALLNQAFYNAKKAGREQLVLIDLEKSAKDISATRLDDLHKEYEVVFPGIANATSIFSNGAPELTIDQSCELVLDLMKEHGQAPQVKQQLEILDSPKEVLRSLYSVGFLGTHDKSSGTFIFCHDGKRPDKEFNSEDRVLIHPCYWMALNLTKNTLNPNEAEEINDEYEIHISSMTPQIREARLGSIIAELGKIKLGDEGAAEFEAWVLKAIKIAFAGHLENIEHHPNGAASQRRDIVALNLGKSDFWKIVREKYSSIQVIFEVKNYENLGPTEYRQMNSYLCNEYGQLGFIVTRSLDHSLRADKELEWFKEMYFNHQKLIIKISAKFLANILSKLRAPQKHNAAEQQILSLYNTYTRMYVGGQTKLKQLKR